MLADATTARAQTTAGNAAIVADRLFPEDYSGSVRDSDGRVWHHTKDQMAAVIARMRPAVLAEYARAVEECETSDGARFDGGLLDTIGSAALRFIDMVLPNRRESRHAIGSPTFELRVIGDALMFADIIEAFGDAYRLALGEDEDPWDSWHEALDAVRDILDTRAQASAEAASPLRVPELGYIAAGKREVAAARVSLMTDLTRRFLLTSAPAADEQARAVIRRHHCSPERVLAVIAERRTLDAQVLGAVLDSQAPAVAEGAL